MEIFESLDRKSLGNFLRGLGFVHCTDLQADSLEEAQKDYCQLNIRLNQLTKMNIELQARVKELEKKVGVGRTTTTVVVDDGKWPIEGGNPRHDHFKY